MPSIQITLTADSSLSVEDTRERLERICDALKATATVNEFTNISVVSTVQE